MTIAVRVASFVAVQEHVDRLEIAVDATADDLATDHVLEHEHVPKRLARVDVADVHLDRGLVDALDRVAQRVARVAERAGVDDDRVEVEVLESVDQRALVVRLEVDQRRAARLGVSLGPLDDLAPASSCRTSPGCAGPDGPGSGR